MSWRALGVFLVSAIGLVLYFENEKKKLEERREASKHSSVGKPLVGGPWSLVDHHGRPVTDLDFREKFMLMYFGYTFCPDVCPEELEKMAEIVEILKAKGVKDQLVIPMFISCDPKRDSIESIRDYVKGTYQQVKRIAKAYRLYFSAPPLAVDDDSTDYLVDHSIFFYLMGPDGKYISHFGRQETAQEVAEKILESIH